MIYTNNGVLTGQTTPANVSGTGASLSAGSWGILPNSDQVKGVGVLPSPGTLEGQSEVIAVFGEAPPAAFDHLAVTATPPQTAGAAFDVTITAQDIANNTVNDSTPSSPVTSPGGSLMEFDWNSDGTYGDNSGTLVAGVKTIKARDKKAETTTITAIGRRGHHDLASQRHHRSGCVQPSSRFWLPAKPPPPARPPARPARPSIARQRAFNVTVNAVDAYWNLVNTVNDTVGITSTDGTATLPAPTPRSSRARAHLRSR